MFTSRSAASALVSTSGHGRPLVRSLPSSTSADEPLSPKRCITESK